MLNFDDLRIEGAERILLPPMYEVEQNIPSLKIDNPTEQIANNLNKKMYNLNNLIKSGDKVAICVGSRGIDKLSQVVKAVIKQVKYVGGRPIIIPAMGSHGGANPNGQKEVLANYGINSYNMGAFIETSMETINLGRTQENNIPVYFSKEAYLCDHIIVINRVKVHTNYSGDHESGILKMLAIGLGKHKGASVLHSFGMDNFPELIPEVAKFIIKKTPVAFGIGLLEDGHDNLSKIGIWFQNEIFYQEANMLILQKNLMPKIPFSNIDLLIIDKMGKDISGSGIDPNIVGRLKDVKVNIDKIYVRDLTASSHGNAAGIGMANFITKKLFHKINIGSTYTNLITAHDLESGKIPMIVRNDKEALQISIKLCSSTTEKQGFLNSNIKIVRIESTKNLNKFEVSKPLLNQVNSYDNLNLKNSKPIKNWIKKNNIRTEFY